MGSTCVYTDTQTSAHGALKEETDSLQVVLCTVYIHHGKDKSRGLHYTVGVSVLVAQSVGGSVLVAQSMVGGSVLVRLRQSLSLSISVSMALMVDRAFWLLNDRTEERRLPCSCVLLLAIEIDKGSKCFHPLDFVDFVGCMEVEKMHMNVMRLVRRQMAPWWR